MKRAVYGRSDGSVAAVGRPRGLLSAHVRIAAACVLVLTAPLLARADALEVASRYEPRPELNDGILNNPRSMGFAPDGSLCVLDEWFSDDPGVHRFSLTGKPLGRIRADKKALGDGGVHSAWCVTVADSGKVVMAGSSEEFGEARREDDSEVVREIDRPVEKAGASTPIQSEDAILTGGTAPPANDALRERIALLERALALREEGWRMKRGGDLPGALLSFRRSLEIYPDPELERMARELESGPESRHRPDLQPLRDRIAALERLAAGAARTGGALVTGGYLLSGGGQGQEVRP